MNKKDIYFYDSVKLEIQRFPAEGYVLDIGGGGEGVIKDSTDLDSICSVLVNAANRDTINYDIVQTFVGPSTGEVLLELMAMDRNRMESASPLYEFNPSVYGESE